MEMIKKIAIPAVLTAAVVALIFRVERIRKIVVGA